MPSLVDMYRTPTVLWLPTQGDLTNVPKHAKAAHSPSKARARPVAASSAKKEKLRKQDVTPCNFTTRGERWRRQVMPNMEHQLLVCCSCGAAPARQHVLPQRGNMVCVFFRECGAHKELLRRLCGAPLESGQATSCTTAWTHHRFMRISSCVSDSRRDRIHDASEEHSQPENTFELTSFTPANTKPFSFWELLTASRHLIRSFSGGLGKSSNPNSGHPSAEFPCSRSLPGLNDFDSCIEQHLDRRTLRDKNHGHGPPCHAERRLGGAFVKLAQTVSSATQDLDMVQPCSFTAGNALDLSLG